jgi:hypothetical protein
MMIVTVEVVVFGVNVRPGRDFAARAQIGARAVLFEYPGVPGNGDDGGGSGHDDSL